MSPVHSIPIPSNEASRLASLRELQLLDTPSEAGYDALVQAAALACGVPISLISLVGDQEQWFKANLGLEGLTGTPRDIAFCAHAIAGDSLFEVPDARTDARFASNPLVTGPPDLRFYAGVPLTLENGDAVGTLCVLDRQPRKLDANQRQVLQHLATAALQLMDQRRRRLQLEAQKDRLQQEFAQAPTGLFTLDARGRLDEANVRMTQLWRQPLLGLLGDQWLHSVHAADVMSVRKAWGHSLANRQPLTLRLRLRGDDPPLRLVMCMQPLEGGRWIGACDLDLSPPRPQA